MSKLIKITGRKFAVRNDYGAKEITRHRHKHKNSVKGVIAPNCRYKNACKFDCAKVMSRV